MSEIQKVGEYGLENSTEGMYARTTNGILGIIVNANSDELINGPEIEVNERIYCVERDSIKDIKENIKDLIEVGDYVNGYRIDNIVNGMLVHRSNGIDRSGILSPIAQYENDIKTIVTNEQFKSIEYEV